VNKPYQSAPLSESHLRLGLLLDFANNVNRGLDRKEMNPMGSLYVFDDHSEIRTPTVVPENWPHGLIRVYREQKTQGFEPEFVLHQFDPAMQTVAFDAKRSGGLDQQGIRFITQTGWHGLDAHYLVMPEFEQLSFIPLIGTHTDSVESILDQSKLGGYDRKIVRMTYEEAMIKEAYDSEDDLELYRGVPHTYHNWIMLNALIVAKIVTLRAIALAEAGENAFRETVDRDSVTGAPLPVDVSGEADLVDPEPIVIEQPFIPEAVEDEKP